MNKNEAAIELLSGMGLTEMEARIYSHLLTESPVTGYRIAGRVDKPVANVYKSLSSLEAKGAVVVEGDKKRLYKPVPPEEFLSLLENKFSDRKNKTSGILKSLHAVHEDEKVYQIASPELLFERMRSMMRRAEATIMLDAFPAVLQKIRSDLSGVLKKGNLEVMVKVYRECRIPGARTVLDSRRSRALEDYPGEWVRMVVDGSELILGLLSRGCEAIHQAVWSASNFLSLLHHQSIVSEIILDEVNRWSKKNKEAAVAEILRDYSWEKKYDSPGYRRLMERFGNLQEGNYGVRQNDR